MWRKPLRLLAERSVSASDRMVSQHQGCVSVDQKVIPV